METFIIHLFSLSHAFMVFRAMLGVVFIAAGVGKLLNRRNFCRILEGYKLLPKKLVLPFASALPICEFAVGLSQFSSALVPWSQFAAAALLVVFTGAIATNLFRGRYQIACGCGVGRKSRLSWRLVIDNLALIGLTIISTGIITGR